MSGLRKPTFGVHNPSPIKKRNKKKTSTFVTPPLQDVRRMALLNRLEKLRNNNEPENLADSIMDQCENEDLEEVEPEAMDTPMCDDSTKFGNCLIYSYV